MVKGWTISKMQTQDVPGWFRSTAATALWLSVLLLTVFSAVAQPVITKQPASFVLAELGSAVQLTVEAQGEGTLMYQWRLNGVNLPDETDSTLEIKNLFLDDCGTYSVAVSDDKDSTNSAPARVVPAIAFFNGADLIAEPFGLDPRNQLNPAQGILRTSNTNATSEIDEPLHAGQRGGKSIWFKWVAPKSGIVTFTVRGSGFDTLLAAYVGKSARELQLVSKTSEDDDVGGFLTSRIQFNALADTEYMIAVDGFEGGEGNIILRWNLEETESRLPELFSTPSSRTVGPGSLVQLSAGFEQGFALWFRDGAPTETTGDKYVIDKIEPKDVGSYLIQVTSQQERSVATMPADVQINITDGGTDETVAALDKMLGLRSEDKGRNAPPKGVVESAVGPSRGYSTTQIFSTVGATKDPGEPNHCGIVGGASEWFSYQAPANGTLHINTDGSSYDTVLAVYTGSGFDYASLSLVSCNNSPGVNGQDRVRFSATSGTIYYIAVDGVGGASGTVQLNINLGDPPLITAQPQSKTVATGSNVTFTVTATGTATLNYQWRRNGNPIAGATTSSYTTNAQTTANYTVIVSNLINTVTSSIASLTVIAPPSITTQPSSQNASAGDNVSFSVVATGGGTLRYQWKFNNANLLNQTNSTLNLTNVQDGNVGTYIVVVTNTVGSVTSSNATLSLNTAPAITAQPASQTVAPGGSVTLNVSATGTPVPSYQWFFNSAAISGATTASLSITNFQSSNEGAYSVSVSNSLGSITSATATLALSSPMRVGAFTQNGDGTFSLQVVGEAGSTFILQSSTNLTDWISVQTNSSPSGWSDFPIPAPTPPGFQFYRVIEP